MNHGSLKKCLIPSWEQGKYKMICGYFVPDSKEVLKEDLEDIQSTQKAAWRGRIWASKQVRIEYIITNSITQKTMSPSYKFINNFIN